MEHETIGLFIFCVALSCWNGYALAKKEKNKSALEKLVAEVLEGYTKQDPPSATSATAVSLGILINSFYSINEGTMDYMVSFDLRQQWKDPRLKYNKTEYPRKVKLGDGMWNKLWIPDTFFRNEKKADFHDVTVANRMIRLDYTGTLLYATKISATFSCQMQLQKYPLDTQICPISIESFGYTMDTMYFAWLEGDKPAIDLGKIKQLPQFTLEKSTQHDCTQNYTGGVFPCLEVRFVLRRDIGFFLIQVYVPSILIVILSWVSFWINIESSPARVSIGLLTVLTTTTMSGAARASLPRVSYIKAIDVWMIICLIFVFTSLIEYAVVNVMSRKQPLKKSAQTEKEKKVYCKCTKDKDLEQMCKCFKKCKRPDAKPESDGKKKARNIDKLSRQCFPLAFILFNVVYWTAYTVPSSDSEKDSGAG